MDYMDKEYREMREKTFVSDWEFKIPLTISVVTHHENGYANALKQLSKLTKDDVYKAFQKALFLGADTRGCARWYGGEVRPEEGIYLRELTYDEKYRGKQTEEIPIPLWIDDEK